MSKFDYQVIEDNGGGLHLFIWHGGKIRWGCSNLEYLDSADFAATLDYIERPGATLKELRTWDSQYQDPAASYTDLTASEYGWESIAIYENSKRTVHPERMGRAGQLAFGLSA